MSLPANDSDCPNGGIHVETGIDDYNNNQLEDAEVDTSTKVCNGTNGDDGSDGADGINALVSQAVEPAGINCTWGGIRFDAGIDNNPANGHLRLT